MTTLRIGKAGFTLIEVLVSVVILAAGAPLIMQALARVSYAHAVAE
ncbi:MAG: type II secretion system protein, partial [Candidatus Omnitrophica bacterium]|nr:type II secretion system protein [Candidatus Omnitrophota bacterium]